MQTTSLGDLVAAALIRAGCVRRDGDLSTYEARRRTGVSDKHIMKIVRGETSPSIATLERIFAAIGWEVIVFFKPRGKRRKKPDR